VASTARFVSRTFFEFLSKGKFFVRVSNRWSLCGGLNLPTGRLNAAALLGEAISNLPIASSLVFSAPANFASAFFELSRFVEAFFLLGLRFAIAVLRGRNRYFAAGDVTR